MTDRGPDRLDDNEWCRGEVERIRKINAAHCDTVNTYIVECARQADRIKLLEGLLFSIREQHGHGEMSVGHALRKYGTHTSDCNWRHGRDCDCGLEILRMG